MWTSKGFIHFVQVKGVVEGQSQRVYFQGCLITPVLLSFCYFYFWVSQKTDPRQKLDLSVSGHSL